MQLSVLISKIKNTRDYENLKARIGNQLGSLIYKLVDESSKADKELDIVHNCITKLYDTELNIPTIKECLSKIEKIKP
jgi:hypothetical protein